MCLRKSVLSALTLCLMLPSNSNAFVLKDATTRLIAMADQQSGSSPASNLITNGSFETGTEFPGMWRHFDKGSPGINGWDVEAGSVDVFQNCQTLSGRKTIDLNGEAPGTIRQTFATAPGATYKLSLIIGGHPLGGPPVKQVFARAAGQTTGWSVDTSGSSDKNLMWRQATWQFTAKAPSTTLEIGSMIPGGCGPMIDDVEVVKVCDGSLNQSAAATTHVAPQNSDNVVNERSEHKSSPKGDDGYYSFMPQSTPAPRDSHSSQTQTAGMTTAVALTSTTPPSSVTQAPNPQPSNNAAGSTMTENLAAPNIGSSANLAGSVATTVVSPAQRKVFLFKATKNKQVIYLLGTIHVARDSFYPLPFEVEDALRDSKDLYLECDMKSDKKMETTASAKRVYGPGDGLSKHISPETRRALDDYLEWAGESEEMYEPFKPFVVAGIIGGNALRRANFKGELGIDFHLYREMKVANKPVLGLEPTADHMLGPDATKNEQDQERSLRNELADLREVRTNIGEMESLWRAGDVERFDQKMTADLKDPAALADYKKIVWDRNASMVASLERQTKTDGPHFVAVGSAHIGGDKGMVALLKKDGYVVEQVYSKPASHSGSKFTRLSFPEGHFSILLPGNPDMKYKDMASGMRFVDYTYEEMPWGIYKVEYGTLPGYISKDTANGAQMQTALDKLCTQFVSLLKAKEAQRFRWNPPGGSGRELDLSDFGDDKLKGNNFGGRMRFCFLGNRFYLILAAGTNAWLHSPAISQYMDSFVYRGEEPPSYGTVATPGFHPVVRTIGYPHTVVMPRTVIVPHTMMMRHGPRHMLHY